MKNPMKGIVAAAALLLCIAGCQKQSPVQLIDDDLQSQHLEVENTQVTVEPFDATSAQDSSKFFLTSDRKYFGSIIVAGSEYDSPIEHHVASLAQATIFDRSLPVIFNGDTIGFRAVNAGIVSIDNLPLNISTALLTRPDLSVDTIGVRYSLLNVDGVGGRGFEYFGNHLFHWDISGSLRVPSFQAAITAPPGIHLLSPSIGDILSLSGNVTLRWTGGGETVRIVISDVQRGTVPKPLIRLRVAENIGRVVIPARILQLLPRDRTRFVFTISSEASFVKHPSGYADDVAFRAITNHSLVFRVTQ